MTSINEKINIGIEAFVIIGLVCKEMVKLRLICGSS